VIGGTGLVKATSLYAYNFAANEWIRMTPSLTHGTGGSGGVDMGQVPWSNHTCVLSPTGDSLFAFGGISDAFHKFDLGMVSRVRIKRN
jgi:hypothetical protein